MINIKRTIKLTAMNEIDFLSLVIDLANEATPLINEKVDAKMTKNQITKQYAINWAKQVEDAMQKHNIIQWSSKYYGVVKSYAETQVNHLAEIAADTTKKKVAKLVTFEFTTRVVVDESEMPEVMEEDACNAAIEKIKQENIENLVCFDNVTDIYDDRECPFGTFYEDLSPTLRCQLFGLYKKAADWLQGLNYENVNELNIINEGADILTNNLEELDSIEGKFESVYEVLTRCVYYINKDFDHEVTLKEYVELGGALVEEISGYLGELFA